MLLGGAHRTIGAVHFWTATLQELGACALRGAHQRCWSEIAAPAPRMVRLAGMSDRRVRDETGHGRVVVTVEGAQVDGVYGPASWAAHPQGPMPRAAATFIKVARK